MNFKYIARRALFSVTLLTFSPVALSSDLYNVKEFEVYGMTLGDDGEQVIKALTEFYSVSRDDLLIIKSTASGLKNPPIHHVEFRANDIKIQTELQPIGGLLGKPDADKSHYLSAFSISWRPEIENYEEFAEKFIEQYGTPTIASSFRNSSVYRWCEKLNAEKTRCDRAHAYLTLSEKKIAVWITTE